LPTLFGQQATDHELLPGKPENVMGT
jgi:hypothetical protein